jgi:hypothetical protein
VQPDDYRHKSGLFQVILLLDIRFQKLYAYHKLRLPMKTCLRCGHQWTPRTEKPAVQCPKCKSPYWNTLRNMKNKKNCQKCNHPLKEHFDQGYECNVAVEPRAADGLYNYCLHCEENSLIA